MTSIACRASCCVRDCAGGITIRSSPAGPGGGRRRLCKRKSRRRCHRCHFRGRNCSSCHNCIHSCTAPKAHDVSCANTKHEGAWGAALCGWPTQTWSAASRAGGNFSEGIPSRTDSLKGCHRGWGVGGHASKGCPEGWAGKQRA